eukprot:CAMPEP_0195131760 /NCGR_PEP_ID=MMETSP0448-20130528/145691_1 /TAXON_ID=66468 /ORGANISM="Heterocapsa triquestra, Strain CCMP 448" /LENGTH=154 /DNA_ID=CAMNT_0040169735 /DNA_START=154 /DNA_END=615 /DNA_ORIENTATION=+
MGAPRTGGKRAVGYIKTFSPASGWGFIICDQVDRDVFFHMKNMAEDPPREHINAAHGQHWEVEFSLDLEDAKKPKAYQVRITAKTGGKGDKGGGKGDQLERSGRAGSKSDRPSWAREDLGEGGGGGSRRGSDTVDLRRAPEADHRRRPPPDVSP